ncbi:D-Ala-D-Ala carboxypeptidase family metallohydrolase [Fusobacterium sp. MFO224]|uniref:D-Ala-D-Ala carboxypeptidase family metallohydrolase n=1 Tax=Fusobacterium sp. MFO224 TaxID=3378070 RepID=UPI003851CAEE
MKKIICVILLAISFVGCGKVKRRSGYKISRNFTFCEATYSRRGKFFHLNNYPNKREYKNIIYIARRMEDIRRIVGEEIQVNSWYRSGNINRLVGGSRHSAHRKGLAVDFTVRGRGSLNRALVQIKRSGYSFDQIYYHSKTNYIHISFKLNRRQERKKIYYKRK